MLQAMDVLLSAVASDLTGRLVSFLIRKYQEPGTADDSALRLQRLLLRARAVVEEAEGRQIANRAMLEQLNQLRRELCRAAYAIDAFRWQAADLTRSKRSQATVSRSRSHTRLHPSRDCPGLRLPIMVQSLEAALSDMREFVVLLGGCPRLSSRQPYSTYLFMENCMFGRQMEKEEIISFLLKPSQDLDVLPIIGPHEVGKRTLVEQVCLDSRVHERFPKVHHLNSSSLDDLHHWSLFDFTAKSLMVINMVDSGADVKESWRKFCSAVYHRSQRGRKILVISTMEEHSSLGTVPAVRLHMPHLEELWYFFRALAFGAADPNDCPDLASLAMALCASISGNFAMYAAANIIAASLRADLSTRSWRWVFKVFSEAMKLQVGAAGDGLDEDKDGHCHLFRPVKNMPGVPCLFYSRRKFISVTQSDLPKVTMLELLTGGSLLPAGKTRFEVLVWQSRIPPYASYVTTCDTDKAHHQQMVALKKRFVNKRRRDPRDDGPSN